MFKKNDIVWFLKVRVTLDKVIGEAVRMKYVRTSPDSGMHYLYPEDGGHGSWYQPDEVMPCDNMMNVHAALTALADRRRTNDIKAAQIHLNRAVKRTIGVDIELADPPVIE